MRTFVIGDPQAAFDRVLGILRAKGLLAANDRLAPDVRLISIGDHFDYDFANAVEAGREGIKVLVWLASHDRAQVSLLLGNHDVSRVMELATIDDAQFAAARELGASIGADRATAAQRTRDEFAPRFPSLATPGLAARDYASFSTEQRTLVIELLLAGRFHLALAEQLPDGRRVLLTHAGITQRELDLLAIPDARDPAVIATELDRFLVTAIAARRAEWESGLTTPLSLEPLHVAGAAGEEGGGLLYHRPSNPERRGADRGWEHSPGRPRRFDPRTLPRGLAQVAGHTGHNKCLEELGDAWTTDAARARKHGGIRTLTTDGARVDYDLGVAPPEPSLAQLILIDGEMRRVPVEEFELLELG